MFKTLKVEYFYQKLRKAHDPPLQLSQNYLADILEKQRMHFLVNYFCSSDTSEAFPKYIIPLLKSKYHKLYVNLICCSSSEEGEGGYYFEEDFIYDNSEYIEEESVLRSISSESPPESPRNCPTVDAPVELIEPGVHFEFDSYLN